MVQARLAALEEDNHREEDFGAGGSDDEEFEMPQEGSGAQGMPPGCGRGEVLPEGCEG